MPMLSENTLHVVRKLLETATPAGAFAMGVISADAVEHDIQPPGFMLAAASQCPTLEDATLFIGEIHTYLGNKPKGR